MARKLNGWNWITIIAGTVIAIFTALSVLGPFVPWAPKELVSANFAMAAENTLDRHNSLVIKLVFLIEQAKNAGDRASQASWQKQLLDVRQKIDELIAEKERRK